MRIAILGKGYVGNALYRELQGSHDVFLVGSSDLDYHRMDVLVQYLNYNSIDLVIGCFGFTGRPNVDEAEKRKKECWRLNVQIPLLVNSVCSTMGIRFMHISSGCIFNGYEKEWTEEDDPNFGLFDRASYYSTTKHAFESVSQHLPGTIIRIRMPFSADFNERSLLSKLLKYDKLVDMRNSKTCIEDLSSSIREMIEADSLSLVDRRTIHMVNSDALSTRDVVEEMRSFGIYNPNWNFVPLDGIPIVAPRSNCVIRSIHLDNPMNSKPSELESLRKCLKIMKECV